MEASRALGADFDAPAEEVDAPRLAIKAWYRDASAARATVTRDEIENTLARIRSPGILHLTAGNASLINKALRFSQTSAAMSSRSACLDSVHV
jgi:hypothetical protein